MHYIDTIRAPITDTALSPEGFLIAKATVIARPGVFPYMTLDGKSMQAKLPKDILSPDTVASANGKAVTNNHPPTEVNAENSRAYSVGMTMDDAAVKDDKLAVTLVVTDAQAIRDVEAGKRELSIGFTADILDEKGNYNGQTYDHVQRNIRINHVAIVDKGRAGKDVAIKDGADQPVNYLLDEIEQVEKRKEFSNMKIKIGDKSIDTEDKDFQDQIDAAVKSCCDATVKDSAPKAKGSDSADAALAMATGYKADLEKVQGENAALNAQVAKLTKDAADAESSFESRVNARVELEKKARLVLGDAAEMPLSEKEIKIAVIKHVNSNIQLADDASMDFINGAYDIAVATAIKTPNVDVLGAKSVTDAADDEIAKLKAARLNLNEKK